MVACRSSVQTGLPRLLMDCCLGRRLGALQLASLMEAVSIDVGTGPAFFSNYKFGGQDFGGPLQIVGTVGAGFNFLSGLFTEYRLHHCSDADAYGPYKAGVNMH